MKTILCDNYQKDIIYHDLLSSEGTNAITDIQLLTLSNLLHAEETEEHYGMPLRLAHLLEHAEEPFPIYQEMFVYPAFIEEILSFARECALYQINPDTLPADTASEAELRAIIKLALTLPLSEKEVAAHHDAILNQALQIKDLECRIRFESDPYRYAFLDTLKQNHPQFHIVDRKRKPAVKELRYARSPRQEIEAIAQEICRRNQPCTVVLCSYSESFPVLQQVFERYQIPYTALKNTVSPSIIRAFTSLVYLALQQDAKSLLRALRAEAFPIPCKEPLLSWLSQTLKDVSYQPHRPNLTSDLLESDYRYVEMMDQKAMQFFQEIQPWLDSLLKSSAPDQAFRSAWSVLRMSPRLSDPIELRAGVSILSILNQTLPEIQSLTDAYFVLRQIESISLQEKEAASLFCTVTDLSHPGEPTDTVYVVGCSAKHYPSAPIKKGLFDEAYLARVADYPSLSHRHQLWNAQLSWLEESSDRVIYSYAVSDYQGREIQPAFEITSRYPNSDPFSFDVLRPAVRFPHNLNEKTAHALFTKEDGKIHSSISRIERYFYCPYSYFIQSGLKIRKPMHAGLDAATIGNFQHAFMEQAVKQNGKSYTALTADDICSFLEPAFTSLKELYPSETVELSLTQDRMIEGIQNTLRILSESEAVSPSWKPAAEEKQFDQPLTDHVQLNGIIDRIDESASSVRVLDYKSSSKSLSEKKIKAGIQLQLLSYIIIAAMTTQKRPAGVYYISMKPDTAPVPAGSFKTANKEGVPLNDVKDISVLAEEELKKRKLAGWAFEDPQINDEYYARFFTPSKGEYSYELIRDAIRELYEQFYRDADSGRISVEPIQGACTFCEYKPICRHHTQPGPVVPLVYPEMSFKKGKEEA
ncbi:MAG: PD-(D/E)XK nuclease family protein [Solobacterium sp.]|nr:PD-(D/E)XK nuclease family protein [Solobacterium sp.]